MARKRYESNFISELKKSVAYYYPESSFWYKIPDDYKFKKPFDIITAFGKKHLAIEVKVHTKSTAWPLNMVEKHQIGGLIEAKTGGYLALIIVQLIYGSGKNRVNFGAVLEIDEFIGLLNQGIKSVKVEDLKKVNCLVRSKIDEIKDYVWSVWSLCS